MLQAELHETKASLQCRDSELSNEADRAAQLRVRLHHAEVLFAATGRGGVVRSHSAPEEGQPEPTAATRMCLSPRSD